MEEQEGHNILYKAKVDEWVKRKSLYNNNMKKSYALIFGYCSKVLQNWIETHVEYKVQILDDPIELLFFNI